MNIYNIIIADDHPILRLGLRSMLDQDSLINVVAEAKDSVTLINKLERLKPQLILLDYFLGEDTGPNIIRTIRQTNPKTKVLVFSHSIEPINIQKSLRAGAMGFISKAEDQSFLLKGIYSIMEGKQFFSPDVQAIIERQHNNTENKIQQLTQREFEIIEYVAKEYSNKEIGAKLFISTRTVETHKRNIMQKLKIKNSVGLVNYYQKVLNS